MKGRWPCPWRKLSLFHTRDHQLTTLVEAVSRRRISYTLTRHCACYLFERIGYCLVVLPAISYAMVFSFGSILISIEIPQLYPELYSFSLQQVGLLFISLIIGSLIGEIIGG